MSEDLLVILDQPPVVIVSDIGPQGEAGEVGESSDGVSDGDKGDIVVTGSGSVWTIEAAILASKADAIHSHAIADVTGLSAALAGKAASVHAHAISDVTGLQDALDDKSDVGHQHTIADSTGLQAALDSKLDDSQKGAVSGLAELDSNGLVPTAQLPGYVDDLIEVANYAALPGTGEANKLYITIDDGKLFRWGGAIYGEVSASLALGQTSSTAHRGDHGHAAYLHALITTGNPHGSTQDDVLDGTTYKQYSQTEKTKLAGIETAADVTDAGNVGSSIHGATTKGTPVDNDEIALIDSAAANVLKKTLFSQVKATLKTYFDTIYQAAGAYITAATTDVLTNKTLIASSNVTEQITAITSSATPTPTGGSLRNAFDVTALAAAAAFQAPSGTPVHRNKLWITIKDNGTARALTWDSAYAAGGVALPTTTVLGKILHVGFIYNTANSLNKWQCVASVQEA